MSPSKKAYADLFSDEKIRAAREKAEQKYQNLTTDQIKYFRRKCKNDLFFLMRGPLEYDLVSPRLHGHLAAWCVKNRRARYKCILLPRDHYKSTCITIADSIQIALPNDDGAAPEHPYSLGPNARILLAHEVREKATGFLFEIAAAFTRKELILALFPECIPTRQEHRVNKWELELPRQQHFKEATFSTIGAGSAAQGGHYNKLKLDDLIGEEARDSELVMNRVLSWFDNVGALLARSKVDGWDLIGTRWAYRDVYSHAFERYGIDLNGSVVNCIPQKDIEKYKGGVLKVYARGMVENGELIFPEEFDWDFVKIQRKNKYIWASQYSNNPMESGVNEFYWPLKFYNISPSDPQKIVVFTGESSFTRRLSELDICIFVDPSMAETRYSDEVGIVVTGVDVKGNIFILETVKDRADPTKFMDHLYKLNFKYTPRVVAIEEVVFSAVFRYWILDREKLTGIHLPVRAFKPGSRKSKAARIRGLAHFFSAGQIYIHDSMQQFIDEYEQFPVGKSEHLLDALAQGPEFWRKGNSLQEIESIRNIETQMLDDRDFMTGY